jgi:PPOX class probable F420-dependent enzyme
MELSRAVDWAASRKLGVLITLRADGRPQSSDIVYAWDGTTFAISVTDDRAKTVNMRRDPRVVLHVTDPDAWSYVAFDGTAELTPVTTSPGDETNDALVAYYERVQGAPHPDWDEYRQAMVDQARLIAHVTPTSAVGQVR